MANPFTSFAFNPTGVTLSPPTRTMPLRLADSKDVRDFGATGLGFPNDDLSAIQAAVNFVGSSPAAASLGTVYFPPGNYYVSGPINFDGSPNANVCIVFLGELGASTITGNFADYILTRTGLGVTEGNGSVIDKLNIVNTNATGGGIRFGGTIGGAIRNCTITANRGISTYNADTPTYFGSFEVSIESCTLSPGVHVSGSQGIATEADGPIINCSIIGYETGLSTAGNEANQNIVGCYFQGCTNAFTPGIGPDGLTDHGGYSMFGCWFKNNSIAINNNASNSCKIIGCRIEGTNGQAPGGTDPQYGILDGFGGADPSKISNSLVAGLVVTGQYDVAGIQINTSAGPLNTTYMGVQCTNSGSGTAWGFGTVGANAYMPAFVACSGTHQPLIYTVRDAAGAAERGRHLQRQRRHEQPGMGCNSNRHRHPRHALQGALQRLQLHGGWAMKSIILAFAIWMASTPIGNTFIADGSNVILTNDSGSNNLLAQ